MVKSWSNLQKRTELILKELAREDCDTAEKLKNIWIKDKKYLLSFYLAWLPEVIHTDVTKESKSGLLKFKHCHKTLIFFQIR